MASMPPTESPSGKTAADVPPAGLPATVVYTAAEGGGTPAPAAPPPVVVPGYEVLSELGRGGMGVVYKARQARLNRLVALKMVLAGRCAGDTEFERFKAEAEAVASLEHPNIVQIHEVNEVEGRPYFSLEFCAGGSLAEQLKGTPWTPPQAAALVEKLARAMHAAHQAGIVHRDLKPANVLLTAPRPLPGPPAATDRVLAGPPGPRLLGEPKITDFGLAKRLDGSSARTQAGTIMGTPSYMAPEQADGKAGEARPPADVYALGAVLYELLTGRPPFKAASPLETMLQVIHEDPVPPRRLQSAVPRDLETICLKCLRKEPGKRYAGAGELADDLKRFLADEPILARPTPLWERGWKWMRRRPAVAALLAVSLLAAVGFLAGAWQYVRQVRADRATALVQTLAAADAAEIPRLVEDLEPYRAWADPMLYKLADNPKADRGTRLRSAIALAGDVRLADFLAERLLDCSAREFPAVRDALRPRQEALAPSWLSTLRDPHRPALARFHAGMALAHFAPEQTPWSDDDLGFLTAQLLEAGRDDQRDLRASLRPLAGRLLPALEARFADPRARTTVRLAAADALADLGRDDPALLARLVSDADAEQYDVLLQALQDVSDRERAENILLSLATETPPASFDGPARLRWGRRRAGAAVTLLHLGDRSGFAEALHGGADPEALTQFVHGVKDRRIDPAVLLGCLDAADSETVRFGLLLALGEFRPEEVAPDRHEALRETIARWYAADPHSSIHGACGWLLRSWGRGEDAARVDRTPLAPDPTGRRDWFVERVGDDAFTFVVFRPGTFLLGSPESEAYRHRNEQQCHVRLTRAFAVCDRELTRGAYERFLKASDTPPPEGEEPAPGAHYPQSRVTWGEAVQYCRWLSSRAGLGEGQQCYGPDAPAGGPKDHGSFHPGRPGFRLPTEAEWEVACRAGTLTPYSFGSDRDLLVHYGRHLQTGAAPVGSLRPSLRGLFDMHGNLWEWCHDRYGPQREDGAVDPVGSAAGKNRLLRGGGWDRSPWHCRSAYRHSPTPDYRGGYMGFRLCKSLVISH
jgi:serine/threonine protein kinase/formylglycine-generating enzyme required for sulfatase activity